MRPSVLECQKTSRGSVLECQETRQGSGWLAPAERREGFEGGTRCIRQFWNPENKTECREGFEGGAGCVRQFWNARKQDRGSG